jgi:hypothetical protein
MGDEVEDESQLPLIRRCMERSAEFEAAGDTANANKWFELAMKAEAYYAKHDNKIAEDYYHIYDEYKEK